MVQIRELLFLMQRETLEKCAERRSSVTLHDTLGGAGLALSDSEDAESTWRRRAGAVPSVTQARV